MTPESSIPPIGTELSFTLEGQARRGWVVAQDPSEIGCYPLEGDTTETLRWPLDNVEILASDDVPEGWEAVSLMDENDQPWIDIRLTTVFMERLREDAKTAGVEPGEMFAAYIKSGMQEMQGSDSSQ